MSSDPRALMESLLSEAESRRQEESETRRIAAERDRHLHEQKKLRERLTRAEAHVQRQQAAVGQGDDGAVAKGRQGQVGAGRSSRWIPWTWPRLSSSRRRLARPATRICRPVNDRATRRHGS